MDRITIKSTIELPLFLVRFCMRIVLLYRRLRFGYPFMRIALAEGNFAIVDPEDYLKLCSHSWQLKKCPHTSYAWRGLIKNGRKITLYMHREIMNPPKGMLIDHINHNGLDNRKANLRFATFAQNNWNSVKPKGAGSRFRGVRLHKPSGRWRAVLCHKGAHIHLGYFDTDTEAARAYDAEAKKLRGDFAVLNLSAVGGF
jgi:hypothetical protein